MKPRFDGDYMERIETLDWINDEKRREAKNGKRNEMRKGKER